MIIQGGVEVQFKAFLISVLDECEWLITAILLLLLTEQEAGLDGGSEEKIFALARNKTQLHNCSQ